MSKKKKKDFRLDSDSTPKDSRLDSDSTSRGPKDFRLDSDSTPKDSRLDSYSNSETREHLCNCDKCGYVRTCVRVE